jgi:GNAT superfamily N-acetyltransferase
MMMSVQTFVKRFRMERRLREPLPVARLPVGFALVEWEPDLLAVHADVKWHSFRDTLDASVFPKLGWHGGCMQLMEAITDHSGFIAEATWLIVGPQGYCGCIQGVANDGVGMIQNLGVLADMRGLGLGRALLVQALHGFAAQRLATASLEVSARNSKAVRLYYDLGFQTMKTLFRETRTPLEDYTI